MVARGSYEVWAVCFPRGICRAVGPEKEHGKEGRNRGKDHILPPAIRSGWHPALVSQFSARTNNVGSPGRVSKLGEE